LPKAAAVSARLSALRCVPLAGPSLPVKKVETLEARESNPGYGQRLETIKFAIFYRVFQGSKWTAASDHHERNRPEEGAKTRGRLRKGFQDKSGLAKSAPCNCG
jgi:hypothetical protein